MVGWIYRLDVSDIYGLYVDSNYELWRDEIIRRIKEAKFNHPSDYMLEFLIENLERADDIEEFNETWAHFYNYADERHIQVVTS